MKIKKEDLLKKLREKAKKGEKGDKGDQGDQGERGRRGEKGETGKRGETGNRGEKGERGEKGFTGEKGDRGRTGDTGEKGEEGRQGKKGEKGEKGKQGIVGMRGFPCANIWKQEDEIISPKDENAILKLTERTLLTTPEKGTIEFNDNKFYITNDGHQRVIDRTSDVMLESVTVENTTTETLLFIATMNANSLFAGNTLNLRAFGIASNVSASDVLTIRIKIGGVTRITIENSARTFSDEDLHITGNATQRTIGVSGERAMHFDLSIGGDNANFQGVETIDTTKNMDITITAQWSNAKIGNIIVLEQAYMQYKN